MVTACTKKIIQTTIRVTLVCSQRKWLAFFGWSGVWVCGNINTWNSLRDINVINVLISHDGTTHWALPVYRTSSGLHHISRSQLNCKLDVLVRFSWNCKIVKHVRKIIFDSHLFKGDNWYVFWFDQGHCLREGLWNFAWLYISLLVVHTRFDDLAFFQGHRCQNHKLQIVFCFFFRFLTAVD